MPGHNDAFSATMKSKRFYLVLSITVCFGLILWTVYQQARWDSINDNKNNSWFLYRVSQKSGTLDFCYFDMKKYSIFWFLQIKHSLLKRMIPRWFDLIEEYWFYNHFLKHSHLQILLTLCELLRRVWQSISSLFVLFAWINGLPGNNVWKSEKP